MALLEWLDGEEAASRNFAALPEVRDGLDRVFRFHLVRPSDAGAKREELQLAVKPLALPKASAGPKAAKAEPIEISKRN